MNGFETNIFEDIRNREYTKAINFLTKTIDDYHHFSGDQLMRNDINNKCFQYYLLRGYCYHKLVSFDNQSLALEDVFSAIRLDDKRFQPYLLGLHIILTIV